MGASSGIGLRCAEILASRGVRVGLAARHTASLEALKEKYPDFVEFMSIDVTKTDAPVKMNKLISALGGMDIYLHVAGIGYENLDLDPEKEVNIINTNACGFARMIDAAYNYFRSNGICGHIAALSSVAGTNGIGRLSAYSASKKFDQAYLVALEQLSHNEGSGIIFTDIRPGWVDTPLLEPGQKYPMEMDVEYVARRIIKALAKKERVVVIDWRWNIVVGLWRMIPNCLWVRMPMKISSPDASLPPVPEPATVLKNEAAGASE